MRISKLMILCGAIGVTALSATPARAQMAQPCSTLLSNLHCQSSGYLLGTRPAGYTDWHVQSVGSPTAGVWVKVASSDDHVDFCGTCGPATANLSTTASSTDTDQITASADVGLTVGAQAEFNAMAVAKVNVKVEESFKIGMSKSSSVADTVTASISGSVSAPPPRDAHVKAEIWGLHSRTATATFTREKIYQARCCPPSNPDCGWATYDTYQCNDGSTAGGTVTSSKSCLSWSRKNMSFYDIACATPPSCPSPSPSPSPSPHP